MQTVFGFLLYLHFILVAHAASPVIYSDANFVLAVDVSGSIQDPDPQTNKKEWTLQKMGIIKALNDRQVGIALEQCSNHGIGLTYVEWAGRDGGKEVSQLIKWTKIDKRMDLQNFSSQIKGLKRSFVFEGDDPDKAPKGTGKTDINSALLLSGDALRSAPFVTDRNVILLSSDGEQNVKGDLAGTRAALIAQNIEISALVIANEENLKMPIKDYFEQFVIGNPGSFVKTVPDFDAYSDGLKAMLLREFNRCLF